MKKVITALRVLETQGAGGVKTVIRQKLSDNVEKQKSKLREVLGEVMEFGVRPRLLRLTVRHIYGPREIFYAPDELLVISVVRNGELHVRSFMEHYLSLGVKHLVFLDNGSTDRTVEMLCEYDKVTVLQTNAPYKKYENIMKRYLAERFSRGRWNLCADIDELFDYPFSTVLSLRDFLNYLNENGYTAVISQMLDMFSDIPLAELKSHIDDRLKETYTYYDLSAVKKTDYSWSECANDQIKMHRGGIRKSVFGTNNGLTKAALVLMDGQVKTFVDWHHVRGARVADISCLLKHYPFVSSFHAKAQDAAQTGRYGMSTTDEYKAYWAGLERQPNLNLKLESARLLTGLEELIDGGFLVVSEQYRQWVESVLQKRIEE
ncbi:MAG: glycosyltransferase family 2 protein [Acidobacteriota bacterium]|nr:glycosyltransferase family 2 protein [Acidobacteriota bacterium]